MRLLAILLCLTVTLCSYSQKAPIKFGDISLEEVKATTNPLDTSASAVILVDFGTSEVKYTTTTNWFVVEFERITRIKILKKDGYTHADFEVPLFSSSGKKEKIAGLKVATYNLEGDKIVETKMKGDGSFTEKYDQNTEIVKFTAPNVKEGSVIEVTYKVISDFLHYFRDWEFQSTIPIAHSEYRAYIPDYFNYEKFMQGYVALAVNETKDQAKSVTASWRETSSGSSVITERVSQKLDYTERYHRWVAKNVPAFKEEPYMTSSQDYISKINFELAYYKLPDQPIKPVMGTWEDLVNSMLESEYFGSAVKGSGFLKKTTDDLTTGLTSPQQKIAAIYHYVKSAIEWDGLYRKFASTPDFRNALDTKKGSSAQINLILVSMLQKAGLNANPLLISTRNHGFVRENFALSSQFNYVLAHVAFDDKSMLLDATDRLLPLGVLPERCINGRGYLISKQGHGWVSLTPPKSRTVVSSEMNLSAQGALSGNLKISNEGYAARRVRLSYLSKGESEYIKDFQHGKPLQILSSKFENIQSVDKAVEEIHEVNWEDSMEGAGTLFINPLGHMREETNPFKLEKREYPVDFGSPFDRTVMFKLSVPDGYIIDELPQSKVLMLPNNGGRYLYNAQVSGNTINITSILAINRNLFSQDEYPALREFYNQVVAKQSEQIVIKKK